MRVRSKAPAGALASVTGQHPTTLAVGATVPGSARIALPRRLRAGPQPTTPAIGSHCRGAACKRVQARSLLHVAGSRDERVHKRPRCELLPAHAKHHLSRMARSAIRRPAHGRYRSRAWEGHGHVRAEGLRQRASAGSGEQVAATHRRLDSLAAPHSPPAPAGVEVRPNCELAVLYMARSRGYPTLLRRPADGSTRRPTGLSAWRPEGIAGPAEALQAHPS